LSIAEAADPIAAPQFGPGVYAVENGAWRWAAGKFTVVLRPPEASGRTGARLELKFMLPAAVAGRTGPVELHATIGGLGLSSQTYAEGAHVYSRDVPAGVFQGDRVTVEFAANKALPPSAADKRELALILTSVGLVPK
jgi:hypothetical protein